MKRKVLLLLLVAVSVMASAADVATVLSELKARVAPDKRVAIWDVKSTMDGEIAVIDGTVGYQDQLDVINAELQKNNIAYKNNIKVCPRYHPI